MNKFIPKFNKYGNLTNITQFIAFFGFKKHSIGNILYRRKKRNHCFRKNTDSHKIAFTLQKLGDARFQNLQIPSTAANAKYIPRFNSDGKLRDVKSFSAHYGLKPKSIRNTLDKIKYNTLSSKMKKHYLIYKLLVNIGDSRAVAFHRATTLSQSDQIFNRFDLGLTIKISTSEQNLKKNANTKAGGDHTTGGQVPNCTLHLSHY